MIEHNQVFTKCTDHDVLLYPEVLLALNPNMVPWMTVLGVLGAAIGYLIGGAVYPAAMVPALYGLCIGSVAGILVRILLRSRISREKDPEDPAG
jgi:hypothetical protein